MKAVKKLLKKEGTLIILSLLFFAPAFLIEHLTDLNLLADIFFVAAAVVAGAPVFVSAVRGILRRDLLDEKFLMCVATIGAFLIGEFAEGAAVMIFYQIGEYFQGKAVGKSRNAIRSLMQIRPDSATVLRDGVEERVDADDVEVGETIVVRTGERIPLDAVVISGRADLDTSALTGESVPRPASPGDSVESGVVVLDGVLHLKTVRVADESAAARVLELVENATERKSSEEQFITVFARVYTPIVVGAAVLMALLPSVFGWLPVAVAIRRALTFLVISCPCALVISVPMAFFGGIGGAASRGILFKGGNVFASVAAVKTVALDKTGTLTTGKFTVARVEAKEMENGDLLSLAASAEYGSNHPIARCIKEAAGEVNPPETSEEIPGLGMIATVGGRAVAIGNVALMERVGAVPEVSADSSFGVLYVAIDGRFCGTIFVSDTVKPEAKGALAALFNLGVSKTVMLSGDRPEIAERVGGEIGITEVRAGLRPEDKYTALESMIEEKRGPVMFVGDGINDAPSIARADIGVAMGGVGQDSAIEAADLVIMADDLSRLPTAVRVARKTVRIAKENIAFALIVKITVMILGIFGLCGMPLAVFADVGVAVLDILNAMRTLRVKN